MTVSQADKAAKFRALHEAPGAFIIANPWDGGSARLLAGLGFQALATSMLMSCRRWLRNRWCSASQFSPRTR